MPDIKLADIQGKKSEELISKYSVVELESVKNLIEDDNRSKKLQLRNLVGNKYRDLLKSADDIVSIDKLVGTLNDELRDLTFKKSEYDSRSFRNKCKYRHEINSKHRLEAQKRNRVKVFRNIVHFCTYSYEQLQSVSKSRKNHRNSDETDEDQTSEDEKTGDDISLRYLQLAKQLYLVFYFFQDLLEKEDTFAAGKMINLRKAVNEGIQAQLESITDGYNYDYATNILVAYAILNSKDSSDSIISFLEIRKNHIQSLDICENFSDVLAYIFITLQCVSTFEKRLPVICIREIYGSNSNWVHQTCFSSWCDWLDINEQSYMVDFPLSKKELQLNSHDRDVIEAHVEDWKTSISDAISTRFIGSFDRDAKDLQSLSSSLTVILLSFRKFSSLVTFKISGNELLVDSLLNSWKIKFDHLLKLKLNEFGDISNAIFTGLKDLDGMAPVKMNSGIDLFEDTDISNIMEFIDHAANSDLKGTGLENPVERMDEFTNDSEMVISSITKLNKLISNLQRPAFSIDDTDNTEFWERSSSKLDEFVKSSANSGVKSMNEALCKFFEEINSYTGSSHTAVEYYYIARCLVQLGKHMDTDKLYDQFDSLQDGTGEVSGKHERIDISKKMDSAQYHLLKQGASILSKDSINELSKDLVETQVDETETSVWDTDDKSRSIPTIPGMKFEHSVYKFALSLLDIEGHDYSDVYLIAGFAKVKTELINSLFEKITTTGEMNKESCLRAFADIIFMACFTLSNDSTVDAIIKFITEKESLKNCIDKLGEINEDLKDIDYEKSIVRSIAKYYKTVRLIYYPL